jgi:hypothetical protein
MNKHTPEQRAKALAQAEGIMALLGEVLAERIEPNSPEFEHACAIYAQAVLVKLRLTPAHSL